MRIRPVREAMMLSCGVVVTASLSAQSPPLPLPPISNVPDAINTDVVPPVVVKEVVKEVAKETSRFVGKSSAVHTEVVEAARKDLAQLLNATKPGAQRGVLWSAWEKSINQVNRIYWSNEYSAIIEPLHIEWANLVPQITQALALNEVASIRRQYTNFLEDGVRYGCCHVSASPASKAAWLNQLPEAMKLLKHKKADVRLCGISLIEMSQTTDSTIAKELTGLLNDDDRFVRWAAVRSLRQFPLMPDQTANIAHLMNDSDTSVRQAAQTTLLAWKIDSQSISSDAIAKVAAKNEAMKLTTIAKPTEEVTKVTTVAKPVEMKPVEAKVTARPKLPTGPFAAPTVSASSQRIAAVAAESNRVTTIAPTTKVNTQAISSLTPDRVTTNVVTDSTAPKLATQAQLKKAEADKVATSVVASSTPAKLATQPIASTMAAPQKLATMATASSKPAVQTTLTSMNGSAGQKVVAQPMKRSESVDLSSIQFSLESMEPSRRIAALEQVGKLGTNGANLLPSVMKSLEHPDVDVRKAVPPVLAKIGSKASMKALEGALNDYDESVRIAAARALVELNSK